MNDVRQLDSISAVDIAHRLGLKQDRNSKNFHCFTPEYHNNNDRDPSFSIIEDGFLCHGCGVKGGKFRLSALILKRCDRI